MEGICSLGSSLLRRKPNTVSNIQCPYSFIKEMKEIIGTYYWVK